MALIPPLQLPWWLRVVLRVIPLLPVPAWLKAIDFFLEKVIDAIPEANQAQARADKQVAVQEAAQQGSHLPIHEWVNKHCSGVACPPDLVDQPKAD